MPDKLPKGWVKTNLGEVCLPISNIRPEDSPDSEFSYFDIGRIDNDKNRIIGPKTITGREAPSRARQALKKNDILFSTVRTYLRKIARLELDYPNPIGSTGFAVIRPAEGVSPQFLLFQVVSEKFLKPVNALQTGTSYPAVRASDVFAQPILLAPANEQVRIVAKLDAALSKLERAEKAALRALDRLRNYRSALLDEAVAGNLSRAWRESNILTDTGSELLQRVLKARRLYWEEAEFQRLTAKKKLPVKSEWKSRYPQLAAADISSLPKLPKSWTWATIEQTAAHEPRAITDGPFGSNLKSIHYTKLGARVIRLQNIGDGVFLDEKAYISLKHYTKLKDYAVLPGDIVIRALGQPAPRACKIPDGLGPAIVKADCIRLKVATKFINPDYVLLCLNSPSLQRRTEKMIHGIGRPRLNLSEIKSISIPLPSRSEQDKIVLELAQRTTAAQRMVSALNRQLERTKATRQAIMREAFAGTLVAQDPDEESASTLLENITAIRRDVTNQPKGKFMAKRKIAPKRRYLLDILREHKTPITPEQLFREAGYQPGQADLFYRELASLHKVVQENRPPETKLKKWPHDARILIALKKA